MTRYYGTILKLVTLPSFLYLQCGGPNQICYNEQILQGEYHLEEMMYHENCPRSVQLQPKDKFRMVLFQHEHKDPTASKYFKMVQENFGAPPTPNS